MVSICIWSSRLDKIQNDRKFFHDARSFLKWKVMKKKITDEFRILFNRHPSDATVGFPVANPSLCFTF